MKKKFTLSAWVLLVLILSACTAAATPTVAPMPGRDLASMPAAEPSTASEAYSDKAGGTANIAAQQPATVNRLVIKNADMIIIVTDPAGGMTAILTMANEMGGYVVSSKSYKTTSENGIEVPQANITVRVPSEKLDEALSKIKKLVQDPAKDVRSENVSGKDVTADYVDLSSRLTNLQNTEKQLQRIQETATKTEDVLAVFNRLSDVRQQIEQIKGQMKYFEESAALSSITVQLLSKEGVAPLTIGGWEPAGIVRDAFQALINIGKGLVEVAIWLVIVFLPIGLVLYFPGRWLYRWLRKNMAKPAPMPVAAYYPMPPMNQPPQSGPNEPPSTSI